MEHDFTKANGGETGTCNKNAGIMSYTTELKSKTPWSTCSKNALKVYYNAILNKKMTWCMEGKNCILLSTILNLILFFLLICLNFAQ